MIVVDASTLLEVLLASRAGRAAEERLLASGESLHAPHLIDIEIAQTLRRLVAQAGLNTARAWRSATFRRFPFIATRTTGCCRASGSFATI